MEKKNFTVIQLVSFLEHIYIRDNEENEEANQR